MQKRQAEPLTELYKACEIASEILRVGGWRDTADRLEKAVENISLPMTVVGCSRCKRGYPLRYLAGGMCAECLWERLEAKA